MISMTDKRVVLITGGNTGLGYAIAKTLLESSKNDKGYLVIITSRDIKKAEESIVELKKETDGDVLAVQMDYRDDTSIKKAADWVDSKVSRIDVLVNNGGKSGTTYAIDSTNACSQPISLDTGPVC